ncbi:helix-turn-helix transcriptional regulator [Frigoriflavimonas asaccharolytica]|uniref:HTH luxR-type domain-containing protein n=1 Tax=Frigoriflavimonas asaccharolytica TaxID=2735899 RepID=A0A8J8GDI7_9FLAO|nr:hypothetical protein [Frigoriflavimonas asaccharolytica]NRS93955.1 hypothetical protein [Frigoriflavimonas asaccharolytica]
MKNNNLNYQKNKVTSVVKTFHRKLLKNFVITLELIFSTYTIGVIYFYDDFTTHISIIAAMSAWCLLIIVLQNKSVKNINNYIVFVLLTISVIITFFHISTNRAFSIEYFYFVVIISLPLFFNYKNENKYIIIVSLFTFISYIGTIFLSTKSVGNELMYKKDGYEIFQKFIEIYAFISTVVTTYFIVQKSFLNSRLSKLCLREKHIHLFKNHHRSIDVLNIKGKLISKNIFDKLIVLAKEGNIAFILVFDEQFPNFKTSLESKNKSLLHEDLLLCRLIKLNLNLNDIADSMGSSLRSVESRKYRIRKKFQIPQGVQLEKFLQDF